MEIYPAMGIGDLLVWKMYSVDTGIPITKINLNVNLVRSWRSDIDEYIEFLKYLIHYLFPGSEYIILSSCKTEYCEGVSKTYIYDKVLFKTTPTHSYTNYIVIHTKVRLHNRSTFEANLTKLDDFFKTYKTSKTIILMGEQDVDKENKENTLHKINTIYKNLLYLKENNNVIDLTKSTIKNCNEIADFEKDIQIINDADLNVTFGLGGNYCLCLAFSKNHINYMPAHDTSYNKVNSTTTKKFSNLDEFIVEFTRY